MAQQGRLARTWASYDNDSLVFFQRLGDGHGRRAFFQDTSLLLISGVARRSRLGAHLLPDVHRFQHHILAQADVG